MSQLLSGTSEQHLLQSVVAVARHVYAAAASSIFMVGPDTGELIFAAVAGAGEQNLVGRRFPAGTGIAGWVAMSGQTLIVDHVAETDHFARDAAGSTGYLPSSIMAAPLIAGDACIGVLEVLDPHTTETGRELDDLELLDLLATQAAVSLALVRHRDRRTDTVEWGGLLARLSDLSTARTPDPLAVELLGICLHLLQRATAESSLVR
ncbi:GAF domain-containing protein [Actinoplanes sp. NPDC051859]|uniref:GAF domain-containing protein n=1 Tax=Actinoplanes sp. NPDC051859 TaxID=3363909 RepID=UPI00378878F4